MSFLTAIGLSGRIRDEDGPRVPSVFGQVHNRIRRRQLTADLLSLPCEICGAQRGHTCDRSCAVVAEMILIEREPPVVIHTDRAHRAMNTGAVSRMTFLAQFGEAGPPESLRTRARRPRT